MKYFTIACCFSIFLIAACKDQPKKETMYTLFVGTYTDGSSEGIYQYTFNADNGTLSEAALAAELPNASYLTISDDKNYLYAVQETADFDSLGGGVTAFTLENEVLSELNSRGSKGAHPCHISLSGDGHLAVSNYTGGNVSVFGLAENGALKANPQVIDHKVLDSVKTSHAHMAQFSGDEIFISDLGLDAVMRYQKQEDEFLPSQQKALVLPDGAGPRHFTFSADRSRLYVINELNSSITVFEKNENDDYSEIQTISTLDENYEGGNSCADIHLSPDGRFLYGSNRGENTVVIFEVQPNSGMLTLVGRTPVHGDWPRNFTLDPSGRYLLVANKKSDNIVVFERNLETGTLQFLNETKLSSPVCLKFLR